MVKNETLRSTKPVAANGIKSNEWCGLTTAPVLPGNTGGVFPEFGRWQDVRRIFGIKRGQLYLLMKEGRIRSVSLRRDKRRLNSAADVELW